MAENVPPEKEPQERPCTICGQPARYQCSECQQPLCDWYCFRVHRARLAMPLVVDPPARPTHPTQTAWPLDVEKLQDPSREATTPVLPLPGYDTHPRAALRRALPSGIMIRATTFIASDADRARFRRDLETDKERMRAASAVLRDGLEPGQFTEAETQRIYGDVIEWCMLSEADRLAWIAKYITVATIQEVQGERKPPAPLPRTHPLPVGQLTAIAARDLRVGQFLGGYAGSLIWDDPRPEKSRYNNNDYKVMAPSVPPPLYADVEQKRRIERRLGTYWAINGLQFRNQIALINDYNGYYDTVRGAEGGFEYVDAEPSVMFMEFWYRGVPFVGAVTQRAVVVNSELTTSYGSTYWYNQFQIKGNTQLEARIRAERAQAESATHLTVSMKFASLHDIGLALYNDLFRRIVVITGKFYEDGPDARTERMLSHLDVAGRTMAYFTATPEFYVTKGPSRRANVTLARGREWKASLTAALEATDLIIVLGNDLVAEPFFQSALRQRAGRAVRLYVNMNLPPPENVFVDRRLDLVVVDLPTERVGKILVDAMDLE